MGDRTGWLKDKVTRSLGVSESNFDELLERDAILPVICTPSNASTCAIVEPFTERVDNTSPCISSRRSRSRSKNSERVQSVFPPFLSPF